MLSVVWQIPNATVLNTTDISCNIVCERGKNMNISERLFNLRKEKKLILDDNYLSKYEKDIILE